MKAVTAAQMRALDQHAISSLGIPGCVLMENAGAGAARLLNACLDDLDLNRVLVLCGPGNNGGDGYVVARHLANHGRHVAILSLKEEHDLPPDARTMAAIAHRIGIPDLLVHDDDDLDALLHRVGPIDAVVDALLGTGIERPLAGPCLNLVRLANSQPWFRFALDLPSGIHADTGALLGEAFRADATATFGLPKLGLYLYPGADCTGDIHVVDISLPPALTANAPGVNLLASFDDLPAYPQRAPHVHKNQLGHLLVIAGSPGKAGTALLAGRAALRTGAGLVTVATHSGCCVSLEGAVPDLMVEGIDMDSRPHADIAPMIPGKTAIAVGPGIGTCAEARDVLEFALLKTTLPVVADADTFSIFAGRIADLRRPDHPTVYTPHPGEMARLLGCATAEVAADRPGCALRAAQDTTAVVVLKGAHTIVAAPDGRLSLNLSGTPAMAKAGVGDVLTGMLGAFLGMGMPPYEAACLAVYLHGRCGELAEGKLGTHGVMASDLIDSIPAAVRLACGDE